MIKTAGGSGKGSSVDRLRYEFASSMLPAEGWILDEGCGQGINTRLLSVGSRHVIAVDPDSRAIVRRRNERWHSEVEYLPKQSDTLPFRDGAFHGLVSLEVIEHVADPEKYIMEIARVLGPKGMLVLSTPNRRVIEPYYINGRSPINITHLREFLPEELKSLLQEQFAFERVLTIHVVDVEKRLSILAYQKSCPIPYWARHKVPMWLRKAWLDIKGIKMTDKWVIEPISWNALESSRKLDYEDLVIVAIKDPNRRLAQNK